MKSNVLFAAGLSLLSLTLVAAMSRQESAVRFTTETVRTEKPSGTTSLIERKVFLVGADGRARIDTLDAAGQLRSTEILESGRRTSLDVKRKRAVITQTHIPTEINARLDKDERDAKLSGDKTVQKLGKRVVGDGIDLIGDVHTMQTGDEVTTLEFWMYVPKGPKAWPVIVEDRSEDNRRVIQRKLVSVERIESDPQAFAVPVDYSVVKPPQ